MAEKKRLGFVDLTKAIAFVLVVFGHTFLPGSRLRAIIYSFHMPLFFVLAGYTFSKKPMKTMLTSSAKRLLLPYSLAYLTATVIPSVLIWTQEGRLAKLLTHIQAFIYAAGDGNSIDSTGAFWFLVTLFFSRAILNALLHVFEERSMGLVPQGLICTGVALLGYLMGGVLKIWLPLCLDISLMAVLFMWSGYAMRQTGVITQKTSPLLLLAPLGLWVAEIYTSLPGWNQPLSMLGREYNAFPLAVIGAIAASFLLIKACYSLEEAFRGAPATAFPCRILAFGEYVGRMCMKLYLIHCFDFHFAWASIGIPILRSTAFTAATIRVTFDVLVLLLFETI